MVSVVHSISLTPFLPILGERGNSSEKLTSKFIAIATLRLLLPPELVEEAR
jgi:hypothetical protein